MRSLSFALLHFALLIASLRCKRSSHAAAAAGLRNQDGARARRRQRRRSRRRSRSPTLTPADFQLEVNGQPRPIDVDPVHLDGADQRHAVHAARVGVNLERDRDHRPPAVVRGRRGQPARRRRRAASCAPRRRCSIGWRPATWSAWRAFRPASAASSSPPIASASPTALMRVTGSGEQPHRHDRASTSARPGRSRTTTRRRSSRRSTANARVRPAPELEACRNQVEADARALLLEASARARVTLQSLEALLTQPGAAQDAGQHRDDLRRHVRGARSLEHDRARTPRRRSARHHSHHPARAVVLRHRGPRRCPAPIRASSTMG